MSSANDPGSVDQNESDDEPLWGDTFIDEMIHEANEKNRNPETFMEDLKAGVEEAPQTEFKTVYTKEPEPSFIRRVLKKFGL